MVSANQLRQQKSNKPPFDFKKECLYKNGMVILHTETMNVDVEDLWSFMWKNIDGFLIDF